ncbi:MAG: DUF1232 domain-containing protein [Bacteroidales bacterium]|nr:DUF1232 domain-containing protein [Bacteroidales bacterium]
MDNSKKEQDTAHKARESRFYKKARSKAEAYTRETGKLGDLIEEAKRKAGRNSGALAGVWDTLMACIRLIKAYANGSYREIPWKSLVMIIAAVVYFVMLVDLIPDFLVGFGLLDDAAILGWTIKTLRSDIKKFMEWEAETASQVS